MALIPCPECKKEISDQSVNCIFCGYPIKERRQASLSGITQNLSKTPPPLPSITQNTSKTPPPLPSITQNTSKTPPPLPDKSDIISITAKFLAGGVVIIFLITSCLGESGKTDNSKENSSPKPISEYAYNDYTKDQFPKLYAEWGSKWVSKISEVEKAAVLKIANEKNSCDSIDSAGISTAKSTPKKEIVIYVNCVNGEQFYVSDKDIKADTPISSQTQKAVDIGYAIDRCKKLIKYEATYPASVNFKNAIDSKVTKPNGNVVITMTFESKNALGGEIPHKAKCIFTPDGEEEISIIE